MAEFVLSDGTQVGVPSYVNSEKQQLGMMSACGLTVIETAGFKDSELCKTARSSKLRRGRIVDGYLDREKVKPGCATAPANLNHLGGSPVPHVRVLLLDANVGEVPNHADFAEWDLAAVCHKAVLLKLLLLGGPGSGRSPQQTFGADVFVDVGPMDAIAAAGNLPVAALLGGGMEQPGIPRKRDRDGAAVLQAYAQRVRIKADVCHSLICRYRQNAHARTPGAVANSPKIDCS